LGDTDAIHGGNAVFWTASTLGNAVAGAAALTVAEGCGGGRVAQAPSANATANETMIEPIGRTLYLRAVTSCASRRFFAAAACGLLLGALAVALRPIGPHDLPLDARAVTFYDRNGALLGTILGRDDRHTIAVPLADIAPAFLEALRATEDRRFGAHGALDPIALLRACAEGVLAHRFPGGASTLEMQLARTLVPVSATPWGKLVESIVAQRLENGLSKAQIIEAYANRAPMGSNLYGVEAAARTYFGTSARNLDLAQAALLAGLPNDPVRLDPYRHPGAALARRRLVLARMVATGMIDPEAARSAAREQLALAPASAGILDAAHFLFSLAPWVAPERARVRTTIDRSLQRFVEHQMSDVVAGLAGNDVGQAAAIVLDNRSGDVLAYAGSLDYFDDAQLGRNDGVRALRAPGSALKPFLYELALERRDVRPATILPDAAVAYALPNAGIYRPTDYSEHFMGPVRVRTALANSLNVPAVRVLSRVGVANFLERLHALGFTHLTKAPDYYGLGLTLGGGEVSLFELARAYCVLARDGVSTAVTTTLDGSVPPETSAGAAAHDPAWAYVTDVIADPIARAPAFGTNSILSLPFPAAVKTGTSSDFRDTWTAGFTRDYTVAVWVGNFDGHPMRHVSGVTGAAPLWSRIMLHLYATHDAAAFAPPRGYVRRAICATTGELPGPHCPAVVVEWLDQGDRAQLARAPARTAPDPAYDAWLLAEPERQRVPTRILFPHDGDRFVASPDARIAVEIAGTPDAALTLDGRRIAGRSGSYPIGLTRGTHTLIVRSASGSARVVFSAGPHLARGRTGFSVISTER
jgi:penicillin-binding protein 1C